jgi:DNA-binding NarL/FixJ family response regulator
MRLMIVDDHEVVREGLVATLGAVERLTVIGAFSTGTDALALLQRQTPDVALIDLRLPDISGDELCRAVLAVSPATAVVMLSSYLSEEMVRSSLRAGAAAYVTKSAGIGKLIDVLEQLRAAPDIRVPVHRAPQLVKQLDRLVAERQGALRISPRARRILELAAEGLTNRAIGEQLFVSESAVRFHMQKLKDRFDAHTRAELVARSIHLGVIAPAPDDVTVAQ